MSDLDYMRDYMLLGILTVLSCCLLFRFGKPAESRNVKYLWGRALTQIGPQTPTEFHRRCSLAAWKG